MAEPLPRGAHHHYIGVAGDHLDGVLQGLSLGNGRGVRIGEAEHRPAQAQHGGLEGEVGAGGGLVKQIARHPALTHVHKLGWVIHDLAGPGIQGVPLMAGQVPKIDQMTHRAPLSCYPYSSSNPTTNRPFPQGIMEKSAPLFPRMASASGKTDRRQKKARDLAVNDKIFPHESHSFSLPYVAEKWRADL